MDNSLEKTATLVGLVAGGVFLYDYLQKNKNARDMIMSKIGVAKRYISKVVGEVKEFSPTMLVNAFEIRTPQDNMGQFMDLKDADIAVIGRGNGIKIKMNGA